MNKAMTEEELANLSDDDLMNMAIEPVMEAAVQEPVTETEPAPELEPAVEPETEKAVEEDEPVEPEVADAEQDLSDEDFEKIAAVDPANKIETGEPDPEKAADGGKKVTEAAAEPDYKTLYEQVMAPFKANGKEVKLNSPEEVVQLMQMGANYTKKLQALQPNLRLLKMLENNDLMDEGKISFLIDLDKRNPQAIQKLLKDSGIDPLDIDTSQEPDYKVGNHTVSDEEMTFNSTLEEVASNPVGKETIILINKTWDKKSKDALWSDPGILRVMTNQKESGIYDQISNEVERRVTLGHIGSAVPFIAAYQMVGEEMQQQGKLIPKNSGTKEVAKPTETNRVIETRTAKSKTPDNNDRVRAASLTKSSPAKVKQDFNPLALSDEDFEKSSEMAGRL